MAITQWNPATKVSRGNISVGVSPAIVDINNPVLSEISAGIGLDCSITTFNGTSTTDSESIDWLCDPASEQLPGSTTHTIDDLVIKATGQADEDLIQGLNIGDVVYIWRRDGLEHADAVEANQYVWVWKVVITSIDPVEANNTFVGITAHITVLARSQTAVKVLAAAPVTPTGVTAGTPGAFTPNGAEVPADLSALQALGALGQTAAWSTGEYVALGVGTAHWDGSAWADGAAD